MNYLRNMSTHTYSRKYLRKWSTHLLQEIQKEEEYTATPGSTKGKGAHTYFNKYSSYFSTSWRRVHTYSMKYYRKKSTQLLQEVLKERSTYLLQEVQKGRGVHTYSRKY